MTLRAYTFAVAVLNISIRIAPYIEAPVKNISVKEAAEALGVTTRTIQYKLQNGDLKGTRSRNQYGKDEWRIYPNRQIADAIAQKTGNVVENIDFAPMDDNKMVEAEDVTCEEFIEPSDWRQAELERLEMMAEKLIKPLAERIEAQALALQEQGQIIADQKRQLLLLPDYQKKAKDEQERAEEERKTAELARLEAIALQTQIEALKGQQEQGYIAKTKVVELEQALADTQAEAQREMNRLRDEKDSQAQAIQEQLRLLSETVQNLQRPWWKKMFTASQD